MFVVIDKSIPCLKEIIICFMKTSCWLRSFLRKKSITVNVPINDNVKLIKNKLNPSPVDSYGSRLNTTKIHESQLITDAIIIKYNIL